MQAMTPILILLAETAAKSVVLTLFALFFLFLLRGASPSLRHRATLFTFALLVLLPFSATLPGWLPVPAFRPSAVETPPILIPAPDIMPAPPATLPPPAGADAMPPQPPPPPPPAGMIYADPAPAPHFSWLPVIIGVWAATSALSLFSLTFALAGLSGLRRASRPANAALREMSEEAAWTMDIAAPALRFSDAIGVPIAFGLHRPAILLPAPAAQWDGSRLQAALLHESAHIARNDFSSQLFARIVCALYAWNPLVWRLFSALRAEAEADCDARVVAAGIAAPDYADHLFAIAQQSGRQPHPLSITPAMARPGRPDTLETRLRRLLTPSRRASRRRIALLAAIGLPLILTLMALRPTAQAGTDAPVIPQATDIAERTEKLLAPEPMAAAIAEPVRAPGVSDAVKADPTAFLKWSMDRYAAAKTFRAEWTWELTFPTLSDPSVKSVGPTDFRSIVYAAPNRFHITATKYKTLSHNFICDGKNLVVIRKGYGQGPETFKAPASLATAISENVLLGFTLGHPHFGGSPLYEFFGGSAGLNHLLGFDTVDRQEADLMDHPNKKTREQLRELALDRKRVESVLIRFGPDVIVNSEPCKTVIWSGDNTEDERQAAISVNDGFVRRLISIQRAQTLTPAQKAERILNRDRTMNSPEIKKLPADKQKEILKGLNATLAAMPEAVTTEIFTSIVADAPVDESAFDTAINYPATGTEVPDVAVLKQDDGQTVRLRDLRGKSALLLFSGQEGFKPNLLESLAPLNLRDVVLLPITRLVQVMPNGFPLYRDPTGSVYDVFDAPPTQASYLLIDREGKIAARGTGIENLKTIQKALTDAGVAQE